MNYIKHLTGFFEKVIADKSLNPTHISLYIALFQFWNCNRFKNPISISRDEVMRISKISSKVTYHKCLKELHSSGYIKYEPSYNPFKGSHVFLFNFSDDLKPLSKSERNSSNFEPVTEQVADKLRTATETSSKPLVEQALVPSINSTNISNHANIENGINLGERENKFENGRSDFKDGNSQKEKSFAKKEKEEKSQTFADSDENKHGRQMPERLVFVKEKSWSPAFADYNAKRTETSRQKERVISSAVEKPSLEEVLAYFLKQDFPEREANKFYNYFQSIGWLVGGKTPMADWQAAARNWMLNAPKFISNERTDGIRYLDTSASKDYSEPL
jgi:hypothetical protein